MGTKLTTTLFIAGLALLGAVCTSTGMAAEPAAQRVTESAALATVLAIEKLADKAQQKVDTEGYGSLPQAEKEALAAAYTLLDKHTEPQELFCIAIALHEGYGDLCESAHDRVLWQAAGTAEVKLARQGTVDSYRYFLGLKALYGYDGAGSLLYREMEEEYYAKPGNITNPDVDTQN